MSDDGALRLGLPPGAGGHGRLPQRLVAEARGSLRATDVYMAALIERFELARIADAGVLNALAPGPLMCLIKSLDALEQSADHALRYIDPELAQTARVVSGLLRDAASRRTEPDVG